MPRPGTRAPELAIPVASLSALRRSLTAEAGGDVAARALRSAGHAAGDALFAQLSVDGDIPEASFWRRFSQLFSSRGWGTLSHAPLHPGVAALDAADWVEADPESPEVRPSCFFTTGMLANLLGNAAGSAVAVLEVECRSAGHQRCRFLFGNADALHAVYTQVAQGVDVDAALSEL